MAKSIAKMMQEAVGQKTLVLSKDTCINRINQYIEDYEYSLKRKNLPPQRRRSYQNALEFFRSLKHHLTKEVNNG